jgi:hypothetical protein
VVNRRNSGVGVVSGGARVLGVGDGVLVSEAESLDLCFDLLPIQRGSFESEVVAALKVSPEFIVAQEPSIGVFHKPSRMVSSHVYAARPRKPRVMVNTIREWGHNVKNCSRARRKRLI